MAGDWLGEIDRGGDSTDWFADLSGRVVLG